jgi:hypothetical protein
VLIPSEKQKDATLMKTLSSFGFACAMAALTTTSLFAQAGSGISVPPQTWTMVATHGMPVQAVGWEKLIYSPAIRRAVMLGDYHQQSTEPNTTLAAYSYSANRWDVMDMGGLFHEENMPDAGHSVGMFSYDPNQNVFIYYCCASGSMEPENPWHTWWFDPVGDIGRDKHTAPKPGMTLEGGAAFDSAHNVLVFYDGTTGTWTYNPSTNQWTQQNPGGTPPNALELAMMAYNSNDQKVYLFGGRYGYGSTAIYYNDIYTYDAGANIWTKLSPSGNRPSGREKAGFAYDSADNIFLLYGGHNDSGETNPIFNDTWVYDPVANAWTQLSPAQSPPAQDAPFERLAYDPDDNVFIMVLEGSGGYTDGNWSPYSVQTWLFRYAGSGPNAGTAPVSPQATPGSINKNSQGWAKEPTLAASGNTLYAAWVETGLPFDGTDAAWSHVYVDEFTNGQWTALGGSFNSINSELTPTSGHSESHSPSLAVISGTPWVSYYQATTDNSNPLPAQIYAKSWNGTGWSGGPIGLVHNSSPVYQGKSQIVGVGNTPYIAFVEVDKTIYPQEAFAYVKSWNGTQWALVGTGPLNRNIGTYTATPLSFADSVSIASDGSNPYVAWTEYTSDSAEVNQTAPQLYVSRWNGNQWTPVGGALNVNAGGWAYDVSIAYFNGQPYVAWTERTVGGNAQLFVKTFDGANWVLVGSGALNQNSSSGWAFRPSLTVDSSGLYVAWVEQAALGQHAQVYVSKFSGTAWVSVGGSLNADPVNGSTQRAAVAVVGGVPFSAWGEVNVGSMRQIFVKQWSGSSWVLASGTSSAGTAPNTTSPSAPSNVAATAVSSSQINLSWTASTDNVSINGYNIYRNGSQIGTSNTTSYSDTGLTPGTTYSYTVAAFDTAGNVSAQSTSVSATTPAAPPSTNPPPMSAATGSPSVSGINGLGASTYTCLDRDGDGYGVGPGCSGPDADDTDASVHTGSQAIAKYGSLTSFLNHLGYYPTNIYYLAPGGVDSGNPPNCKNNVNLPCATYVYLRTYLQPGDMVLLRNGWNGRIDAIGGSASGTNVIMSYPGELAVIDLSSSPGAQVNISDISYITLDGLKIQNGSGINGGTADGLTQSDNHDVTIRHIEGVGGGPQGLGTINAFNGLVNWTIEDNVLHDDSSQHCLYIGARGLPNSNDVVRRNLCYNAAWNGFHLNGRFTNLTVDQNIVYNTGIAGISLQEGVSNSRFTNNLIFNTASAGIEIDNYPGDCAQFGQGGTGAICPYDQTGNTFENNTIYMTGVNPMSGGQSSVLPAVTVANRSVGKVGDLGHNTFINNIFYGPVSGGYYPPVAYYDSDEPYLSTSVFANNIFWSADGNNMVIGFGLNTSSYGFQSYTCTGAAALTSMSACINSDPQFVAASQTYWNSISSFNLHLQPSSPAVHAGTSSGAPTYDLSGNTFGNPPSIGAYELSSSVTAGHSACDLNGDGLVNILDVQIATMQALGTATCSNADLQQPGQCTAIDVQRVITAALGGACVTGQ